MNKQDISQGNRHKSTRNCEVFKPLQKMVSFLVWAHLSVVSLTDYTQKVSLFDLESPLRCSAECFCAMHEIFVVVILELGTMEFGWPPGNQK